MAARLRDIVTGLVRPAPRAAGEPTPGPGGAAAGYLQSRWRGQPGRLEVWYTTLTDPVTGTGFWLHHELMAPRDGSEAHAHGWAAIFPPDGPPVLARFGPQPWRPTSGDAVFAVADVVMSPRRLRGSAGTRPEAAPGPAAASATSPGHPRSARHRPRSAGPEIQWDLAMDGAGPPLFTFPRWAWAREVPPGAQIVPVPAAVFRGTIRWGGHVLNLAGAPGATARSYARGIPRRWAWLHADLGAGDVCEVVAATSALRGMSRLPPLPFVKLRVAGRDWPPGDPMIHSARFVASIGLPTWTVLGVVGDRRVRIQVTQPPERTLTVGYTDTDSSTAVCRNSERAHAVINLQRRTAHGWRSERLWRLDGTAHAEVGTRE